MKVSMVGFGEGVGEIAGFVGDGEGAGVGFVGVGAGAVQLLRIKAPRTKTTNKTVMNFFIFTLLSYSHADYFIIM